jgi:DNA-directed RNA polymerase subunit RPC12/RpoP
MVQETTRFLAYICPHCRQSVIVERDLFTLAAATHHVKCPCGHSELTVDFQPNRVKLTVPCLFCGREHTVSCSTRAFVREKALAFACAASGLDCCYVGEEGPVYQATARLEQALDKMSDGGEEQERAFLDDVVMEEILSELKEIASRGGISCACGSRKWVFQVNYSSVDLICGECGAEMRIPAATQEDITDLCCKQKIVIRGKRDQ